MKNETDRKIEAYLADKRQTLVHAVYKELEKCGMTSLLPPIDTIVSARFKPLTKADTAKFFPPPKHQDQTNVSFREQTHLMEHFRSSICLYLAGNDSHRNFVIMGGPGVGKTTVAMF